MHRCWEKSEKYRTHIIYLRSDFNPYIWEIGRGAEVNPLFRTLSRAGTHATVPSQHAEIAPQRPAHRAAVGDRVWLCKSGLAREAARARWLGAPSDLAVSFVTWGATGFCAGRSFFGFEVDKCLRFTNVGGWPALGGTFVPQYNTVLESTGFLDCNEL